MKILQIEKLSVEYFRNKANVAALKDVSIGFEEGETTAIVGESGSGKSTLAFSILGLIFPYEGIISSGKVLFENKVIIGNDLFNQPYAEKWKDIRGNKISIIFQDPFSALNPVLTIREQISEIIQCHNTDIDEESVKMRAQKLMENVMMKDSERILSSYPHQLSGGQRQRVVIAMAIANRPKILIADEPTTSLDVTVQKEIMDLLDRLKKELSLTVILITHNIPLAKQRAQKVAVMHDGRIVEYGAVASVFGKPVNSYTQGLLKSIPDMQKRIIYEHN